MAIFAIEIDSPALKSPYQQFDQLSESASQLPYPLTSNPRRRLLSVAVLETSVLAEVRVLVVWARFQSPANQLIPNP